MARNLYGIMIVIYHCNAHCNMCDCFKCSTKPEEEIILNMARKSPEMAFTDIIGGESFIHKDIPDIVKESYKKSDRIVISTNGYLTDRITDLCREFPKVGVYISIEDFQETNDRARRILGGFSRGYRTPTALVGMGHPDAGFGMTVQNMNCKDPAPPYRLLGQMRAGFATVALYNSFYFRKNDDRIEDRKKVVERFEQLICELLKSSSSKKRFQVYLNRGPINYIHGSSHLFTYDVSRNAFPIDPFCDVIPCNRMCQKAVMGDLREQKWEKPWNSEQARQVRRLIGKCQRSCWMIGSASPVMHKYIWVPAWWVIKRKLPRGGRYPLDENFLIL